MRILKGFYQKINRFCRNPFLQLRNFFVKYKENTLFNINCLKKKKSARKKTDVIEKNVFNEIITAQKPKHEKKIVWMRFKDVVVILYCTGCRIHELTQLYISDFEFIISKKEFCFYNNRL